MVFINWNFGCEKRPATDLALDCGRLSGIRNPLDWNGSGLAPLKRLRSAGDRITTEPLPVWRWVNDAWEKHMLIRVRTRTPLARDGEHHELDDQWIAKLTLVWKVEIQWSLYTCTNGIILAILMRKVKGRFLFPGSSSFDTHLVI